MSKHTPGPWRHAKKSNFGNVIEADSGQRGYAGDDGFRSVCTVQACGVFGRSYDKEMANQAANIALIAAAPEMLDELKSVFSWAQSGNGPLRQQEINSIATVIAKAEGK